MELNFYIFAFFIFVKNLLILLFALKRTLKQIRLCYQKCLFLPNGVFLRNGSKIFENNVVCYVTDIYLYFGNI